MNKNITTNQKDFFNRIASKNIVSVDKNNLFYEYVNKEQIKGFEWLSDCKSILDYGCGIGTSIDLFAHYHKLSDYNFYGVDIAEQAIAVAKSKYSDINFFLIKDNKIPNIEDNAVDGAYMLHVLHHSHNHEDIFKEIYRKLKLGGKFLVNDLTSHNAFISLGRALFSYMPLYIKNKFLDDLVVDGKIPDKYIINVNQITKQLGRSGFLVEKIEYGHLFFFIFCWIDKFIPFSKSQIVSKFYLVLIRVENWLLNFKFFQNYAEVIVIKCVKSDLHRKRINE